MRNLDVLGPGLVSPGGSQLLLDLATTPSGTTCANFVCSGRAAAKATWDDITPVARRDWIAWITSGKKAETRVKRIDVACDKLACGNRRACCFDSSGRFSKGNMGVPEAAK